MMRFAAAIAHACVVFWGAAVCAQELSTEPFAAGDLRAGKIILEDECRALPGAVWVVVEGQGDCIRYYHSAAATAVGSSAAIVFLHGDVAATNGRGDVRPHASYLRATPASVQTESESWSRELKVPYLLLARPGSYGSSGAFAQRRTRREIETVSAALDAIKAAHGYTQLHLVGNATGGHTAAALLARRTDIGCAVLASPLASLGSWLAESGRTEDVAGPDRIDPIMLVDGITKREDLRVFVVTDPDDLVISARSQTLYVRRLEAAGLPVRQVFAAARDPPAHDLARTGRAIAAACAQGRASEAIVGSHQNKRPELAPDADEPPLHTTQSMRYGVSIAEPECRKLAHAVFVRVDDRGFCVRYWMSTAGGVKDEATVYIHGDIGSGKAGEAGVLSVYSSVVTAGQVQRSAHHWSRVGAAPYFAIGRLGAFGSSGNHGDRRSLTEVKVVMAALDVLKGAHKIRRFHLVGQSGGGHTVAALLQLREDIGCAVMTSGSLSSKTAARDRGLRITERMRRYYDPIDHVGSMRDRPGQRMFVLSDPQDRIVSFGSQREFVERVRSAGLPIVQIAASAGDEDHHGLQSQGLRLAADCARGVDDQTLIARYRGAPPAAPQ